MDGRKRWSSFDDGGREMRSYGGRDTYKFARTTSGVNEHYNKPHYDKPAYDKPAYDKPPYDEHYNANYGEHPNEHYNGHYAAPFAAGPSRYNSDVSSQRFPKEAGVQRAPWNQNKPESVCCCPAHEGNMCATLAAALPGLLSGAGGQGGLMMKPPFLHFPVNNNTAAPPLFPNLNTFDPVQKAVIKHTFGGRGGRGGAVKPKRRKQPVKCGVCQVKFNSDSQAEAHYRGSRHAKKLKMQQSKDKLSVNKPAKDGGSSGGARNTEAASSSSAAGQQAPPTGELYCSLCKVSVNSVVQLEAHNSGTKHKTMLDAQSGSSSVKAFPRAGAKVKSGPAAPAGPPTKGSGLQNKTFQCETCNIHVNSEIQLKQHISSRKHKDRLAGKPTKPKFNKSQRMEVTTSSDLASPLPGSASLPHPAPGPIRGSQGSALFTPY